MLLAYQHTECPGFENTRCELPGKPAPDPSLVVVDSTSQFHRQIIKICALVRLFSFLCLSKCPFDPLSLISPLIVHPKVKGSSIHNINIHYSKSSQLLAIFYLCYVWLCSMLFFPANIIHLNIQWAIHWLETTNLSCIVKFHSSLVPSCVLSWAWLLV